MSTAGEDVPERRRRVAVAGHRSDAATARAALDDPSPSVRAAAIGALERTSALSDADVERVLGDPAPEVRRRAIEAAARRPRVSLLAVLTDDDAELVEVAAWACGEQDPPHPGAVGRLADLAQSHPDALVREAAAAALGAIGDPHGLPAILAATRDKATVRRRAVLALAPFEGSEVDEALERTRRDRDWQVRQAAEDLLAD